MSLEPHPTMKGVFFVEVEGRKRLATRNLVPGIAVYGEQLVDVNGEEFRVWNPYRSKLAAGIVEGMRALPQIRGQILYLGAASGTTVSHVSDIVGHDGQLYCVEFSLRVARKLVQVSESRRNVVPLISDARNPSEYAAFVPPVDIIYQDVSQPEQAEILIRNAHRYLKDDGRAIFAVKARSIDVTRTPEQLYVEQAKILEQKGFEILETKPIDRFERDHALIVAGYVK